MRTYIRFHSRAVLLMQHHSSQECKEHPLELRRPCCGRTCQSTRGAFTLGLSSPLQSVSFIDLEFPDVCECHSQPKSVKDTWASNNMTAIDVHEKGSGACSIVHERANTLIKFEFNIP